MLLRNIFSTGIFNIGSQLLIFGVEIIVARLLLPEDFGIYAISLIVVELFSMFSLKSMAIPFVQYSESNDKDLFAIAILVLILGIFFSITTVSAVNILAQFIGHYLVSGYIILGWLIPVLSLEYVYRMAMMKKEMYWKVGAAELYSVVIYVIVLYILASNGFGYQSLLLAYATRCVFKLIIVIMSVKNVYYLFPSLEINRINKYMRMALGMTFQGMFLYSTANTDKYFANLASGVSGVGIYSRALKLVQMPLNQISRNVSSVLFVEFSRLQNDIDSVKIMYEKVLIVLCSIFFSFSAFIYAFSDKLVMWIYGESWQAMAPILDVVTWGAALTSISIVIGDLLKSRGIVYRELVSNVICLLVLLVLSLALYDKLKLVGIAWAFVASQLVFLILQASIVARILNITLLRNIVVFITPLLFSVIIYFYSIILRETVGDGNAFVLVVVSAVLSMAVGYLLFKRGLINKLISG
uniref:oligosaccharide flippase family protein n=1 Tax=Vibrio anguillarum TaxID=55601 RepID=UPI004048A0FB